MDFQKFKYLSFDCYGTLIDWEQGILQVLSTTLGNYETVSQADALRSFAKWEAEIESGPFLKYRDVLTRVQAKMCKEFSQEPDNKTLLADSVGRWPPFADTSLSLRHLKQRYGLAILSNVDRDMFAQTQVLLDCDFDLVCTAEEIGSYKPALENFKFLLDRLKCDKAEILHVAQSLFHDHVPSRELGIQSIWVNRPSLVPGQGATLEANVKPEIQVGSMAELVQMIMPF